MDQEDQVKDQILPLGVARGLSRCSVCSVLKLKIIQLSDLVRSIKINLI